MAIVRTNSSFIIGFEQMKQKIELAQNADKKKDSKAKGEDKAAKSKAAALEDTEAFRNMREHIVSLEELCSQFDTDLTLGLTEIHAQEKLKAFGPNKLTEKQTTP